MQRFSIDSEKALLILRREPLVEVLLTESIARPAILAPTKTGYHYQRTAAINRRGLASAGSQAMPTRPLTRDRIPFRADQLEDCDRDELSNCHPMYAAFSVALAWQIRTPRVDAL